MPSRLLLLGFLISAAAAIAAQNPDNSAVDPSPILLDPVIVTGQLDQARDLILPDLGATAFFISEQQIESQPQGADAPFNQVLLRAPGVAEDSAANGDLHVRGEHANLQYRINGVLLPEGITGFGLELDPRFVSGMQLITGSLPAEYGFRTAGIVDITTKSGSSGSGGDFSLYGGGYGTLRPSFETAGSDGKLSYFADASYDQSDLGIENPTASSSPIHDRTRQSKTFGYLSYVLDASSRVSFMASVSSSDFQIPDTPGLPAGNLPSSSAPGAVPWFSQMGITGFDSADLNENQSEQNYYGVGTYQKSADNLNLQVSAFARDSGVRFMPDPVGDLYFNGVASDVNRTLYSTGWQGDASYELNDRHTLRGGALLLDESVDADSTTTLFPVDGNGNPTGPAFSIADRETLHGLFAGLYLQDEWTLAPKLTVNYGGRFDLFDSSFDDEHQVSPRLNLIFSPTDSTALHAGYSRYFTPPPVENVPAGTVAEFAGTSNQSSVTSDDPVRAERSDYFDGGISQKLAPGFQMGVDAYYKRAQNQLDDGLFGQTLILSAFNYAKGEVSGQELTVSYAHGGFSSYANLAHSVAKGEDWNSAQFLFDPADLAYVKTHWIFLDHDQTLTGSFGAAYRWKEARGATGASVDAIYGTGLRTDASSADGSNIPNGGSVPAHFVVNIGMEQSFRLGSSRTLKTRLDLMNLTDRSYELRGGTGVGVNAAQYGMRRGVFGSADYPF